MEQSEEGKGQGKGRGRREEGELNDNAWREEDKRKEVK